MWRKTSRLRGKCTESHEIHNILLKLELAKNEAEVQRNAGVRQMTHTHGERGD